MIKMAETSNGTLAEQLLIDDSDVPDWLLTEILQRLPVKHIFMFKCVSKRWFTLISDPFFARSYATRINRSLSLSTSQPWNLLSGFPIARIFVKLSSFLTGLPDKDPGIE
ncbi:F-box and associated interaction domains-containing protein [Theobroma cacao]|uniref:F-box and associated interaction domains-containing protein n=1 Tax=Theobroma cacao TaxID=3641 RepID=A0A061GU59_THECC|nr:F-box and associated interaction domains-containing protein [Theobroma cacao]